MVNLALTDEQVRTERDVVAEERLGAVEDSVDGTLDETDVRPGLPPPPLPLPGDRADGGHQGGHPGEGHAFLSDLLRAQQRGGGGGRPLRAGGGARRHRAQLRRHPALRQSCPPRPSPPESAPAAAVRQEIQRPVPADRLVIGLRGPALAAPDRAAFEVLDEILTGGPSARLYRRLVIQEEMASSVDGSAAADPGPGALRLVGADAPGPPGRGGRGHHRRRAGGAGPRAAVATPTWPRPRTGSRPPSGAALASSEGKASQLGEFEVVAGDYRKLLERAGRDRAGHRRRRAAGGRAIPDRPPARGGDRAARRRPRGHEGTPTPLPHRVIVSSLMATATFAAAPPPRPGVGAARDRPARCSSSSRARPAAGVGDGRRAHRLGRRPARARRGWPPSPPSWRAGAPAGRPRAALDDALDALGAVPRRRRRARLGPPHRPGAGAQPRSLPRHAGRHPAAARLHPGELGRTRKELLAQLEEARNDDRALCGRFFERRLYGDHPYGRPPEGTAKSLPRIRRDDILRQHRRTFVGANLVFAAAGGITLEDFARRLAGALRRAAPRPGARRRPRCPPRPARPKAGASSWSTSPIASRPRSCSGTPPCPPATPIACPWRWPSPASAGGA